MESEGRDTPPIRRVCHVIGSLAPAMGGLPKTAVALAAAQSLAGAETAVVFFESEGGQERIRQAYGHFPGFEQIQFFELTPGPKEQIFARGLSQALRSFGPELLHTHGLWEPVLMRTHRYALRHGIPYVMLPQSMLHPWQSRHWAVPKALLLHLFGWKVFWQAAAFIQVLSEAEAGHWREAGYSKLRIIPNGIFPEEQREEEKLDLPFPASEPFLLSLARLHPQKAPEVLLEAFSELGDGFPGLHLVLAGPDYGMRAELEMRAKQLGCGGRVHFPGMLEGASKWAALRVCACFCLPSRAEGFSLALLEAALAGAPCVISEGCYFDELLRAEGARLTKVDSRDLAKVLRELLSDSEGARRMGNRARDLVLRDYTWDRIARQLLEAYAVVHG
jgi:glycosyltransferase involved in cell wall biosynthesis